MIPPPYYTYILFYILIIVMSSSNRFLSCLQGELTDRPPFWFMRQAGRYLPEYQQVRKETGSFLDLCYNPKMAAEVTVQPIRRFGMDAAIIFSDILVIPHAMGLHVHFEENIGPVVERVATVEDIKKLDSTRLTSFLRPVYAALEETRALLPPEVALIGFAGAPWTLACYMLEGKTKRDYAEARTWALQNAESFANLLDLLTQAVIEHLRNQITAGAQAVQIFDSWANVLSADEFTTYCLAPAQKITAALKQSHPHVPVIGFPRHVGRLAVDYAKHSGITVLGVDDGWSLEAVAETLQPHAIVQGNLNNLLLKYDLPKALQATKRIVDVLGKKPFVFNLGHGVLPQTPVENVQAISDYLRSLAA